MFDISVLCFDEVVQHFFVEFVFVRIADRTVVENC